MVKPTTPVENGSGEPVDSNNVYFIDGDGDGAVDAGERLVFFSPVENGGTGHYYELVHSTTGMTWDAAVAAAGGTGRYLLTIDSDAEATFIRSAYAYEPAAAATWDDTANGGAGGVVYPGGYATDGNIPVYGGLPIDHLAGSYAAWVGLQAVDNGVNPSTFAWTTAGAPSALSDTSDLWLVHDGSARPSAGYGSDQRGAIVGGNNNEAPGGGRTPEESQILFHLTAGETLNYYIVEYESVEAVNATMPSQSVGVTLDAVTGPIASIAPSTTDALPASSDLSSLIEQPLAA